MDIDSESESVYSLDSLENEKHIKSKTNTKKCPLERKFTTVPYYTGEISVEVIKSSRNIKSGKATVFPKISKTQDINCPKSLEEYSCRETVKQENSCFWNYVSSKSKVKSNQRISRRKELIIQNKDSLKARHRSVSYVEQFRKKYYGNSNLDSSSYSTAGSKLSNREESMSNMSLSCLSDESRISVTEFDFDGQLMESSRGEPTWCKDGLKSSTLLTEKEEKSTKTCKPTKVLQSAKQNKEKPIILSRIEVTISNSQKSNLDKKRSLEKREMYANNVKLRNQMKINRQKEREKNERFNAPRVLPNFIFDECILQSQPNNVCFSTNNIKTSSGSQGSRVTKQELHRKNNEKNGLGNELVHKPKRREKQHHQNKKSKKTSELLSLQERHEREKSLIESMKNLILKT